MFILFEKIKNNEIFTNLFWRSIQIFGRQGINLVIFIVSAKLLSPYDFGVYNYVFALVLLLSIFGDFGISSAASKYAAEYSVRDRERLKHILSSSASIIISLGLIISILVYFFGRTYLGDSYIYILYLLPLLFLIPLTALYDGIYRGLGRFKELAIVSSLVGLVSVFFIFILINKEGLMGALLAQILVYLLLLIFLALGFREFHFKISRQTIKEIASYSFIIGIASVGYFLFSRINTIILGRFGLIVEVGYYEIINKVVMLAILPFTIFAQVIAPNVTRYYAEKSNDLILKKFKKYMIGALTISVLGTIATYCLFPVALKLFFSEYNNNLVVSAMTITLTLIVTQCLVTVASIGFSVPTGHAKISMLFLMIFGLISLPITIYFTSKTGFIGLVYSSVAVKVFSDIFFILFYYQTIKKQARQLKLEVR